MPGRSPHEAVEAFLEPLREAVACVGTAHITLSPGARGAVGETHAWTLNGGDSVVIGGGYALSAQMHFETLDRGQSLGSERFRVSTRAYRYAIRLRAGDELIAAHWHPTGNSPVTFPHWHVGSPALASDGVFLERAHIPAPRVSFEAMIRWAIESISEVQPTRDDWRQRLESSESTFDQFKTWGE